VDPEAWDRCPPCTTDDDIRALVDETIDRTIDGLIGSLRGDGRKVQTHHPDCWQHPDHHACAVRRLLSLASKAEALADHWEKHGTGGPQCIEELRDLAEDYVCPS
jgi:hypothetical protein